MDFNTKEDFKKIRKELLNKLYNALKDGEPNAQIMKFAKEILDEANISMLDKDKDLNLEIKNLFEQDEESEKEIIKYNH